MSGSQRKSRGSERHQLSVVCCENERLHFTFHMKGHVCMLDKEIHYPPLSILLVILGNMSLWESFENASSPENWTVIFGKVRLTVLSNVF